jgi:hypothetical protein
MKKSLRMMKQIRTYEKELTDDEADKAYAQCGGAIGDLMQNNNFRRTVG